MIRKHLLMSMKTVMTILLMPAVCFLACSCAATRAIPDGVYISTNEQVLIQSEKATLKVYVEPGATTEMVHREFDYFVDEEGWITWMTMTSNETLTGVGRYDWRWNGEDKILKSDSRTQRMTIFVKQ